jgi:hypothetical protein
MKCISLFLIISIILTSTGCKDKDGEAPAPSPSIQLIFPTNGEISEHCCFTFEWSADEILTTFSLVVSTDSLLNEISLDTVLTGTQFILNGKLDPGQIYYWKVSSGEQGAEAIDSFQVKDYAAFYSGNYPVEVRIENWDFVNGITWDTVFGGNMDILKINEHTVEIFEHATGKERAYIYMPSVDFGDSTAVFMYNDASRTSFCTFNFVLHTFYAGVTEGGVGSRTYYHFRGMK